MPPRSAPRALAGARHKELPVAGQRSDAFILQALSIRINTRSTR
jgi:hypothetical protein